MMIFFDRFDRLRFFLCSVIFLVGLPLGAQTPPSAAMLIPEGSLMAGCKPEMPRLLLNPCDHGAGLLFHRDNMVMAAVENYPGVEPKIGRDVLKFRGRTNPGGNGKGDFILSKSPPGHLLYLGAWVYLEAGSNVSQVGLQMTDAEGENFTATIPANWQGWKWIEFGTDEKTFQPAGERKNGKIDFPLQAVHFAWSSPKEGENFVGVDGLAAVAQPDPADKPYTIDIHMPGAGEGNGALEAQAVVNNFSDKPVEVQIRHSIQTNPQLDNRPVPDPVMGANRAQGCKSWVELDGKRIEDDSLTNDEPDTFFNTDRFSGYEGFQFLDLGQARKISGLSYVSGDASRQHKIDFSASLDGKNYTVVEGLQGIDTANQWGGPHKIPVPKPFEARFLKLRYHSDGKKMTAGSNTGFIVFYAVSKLLVYDGLKPGELDMPKIGAPKGQGIVTITAPPHGFALAPLSVGASGALAPGSYYFEAVAKGPDGYQLFSRNYFARPTTEVKTGPDSRFGMNASVPGYAQELKRLGVGWIRYENMQWPVFNDGPGKFNYERTDNVPLDTSIGLYHEAGLSVMPYIMRTPLWATSAPPENNRKDRQPPKDYDDYAKALFETAARYGSTSHPADDLHTEDKKSGLGWITAYELWSEPNNPPEWGDWAASMDKYFELFRKGAEAVKRADPASKVSIAGFSGIPLETIDRMRTYQYPDGKNVLDFTDILNVHYYTTRQEPEWATIDPKNNRHGEHSGEVATFEKMLRDLADWRDHFKPSMPIWLTETGYDVDGPMGRTERSQAAKIPRDLMLCLANGVEKVFLYRETGSTVTWHNHTSCGVMREDNTLRPSYFTMATLTRQLDGVTDLRTPRLLTTNPKVWLYNWKRGQDRVLAAWTPEGTEPLGLELGKCHVTDAFGFESDVEVGKDFPLSMFPVYITRITQSEPVTNLEKEAATAETQRRKAWDFLLNKAHVYLYDFGSHKNVLSETYGLPRPVIPVEAADAYDAAKGFGFVSKEGKDNWVPWETDTPLEKGSVSFPGPDGFQFQVDAAPGSYELELRAVDAAPDAKLTVVGAQGGDVTVLLINAGLTKVKITTAKQPLVFKLPPNIKVQWLMLVETQS